IGPSLPALLKRRRGRVVLHKIAVTRLELRTLHFGAERGDLLLHGRVRQKRERAEALLAEKLLLVSGARLKRNAADATARNFEHLHQIGLAVGEPSRLIILVD